MNQITFIKNIRECINQSGIEFMLATSGIKKPKDDIADYQIKTANHWISSGYKLNKIGWESFNTENVKPNNLPFKKYNWWYSKLNPGDIFPMHIDTYPIDATVTRYWVACQDHLPGHIFMYDNSVLTDYKAGDMFMFDDHLILHGACNIGFVPKISLQIVVYED